MNSVDHVVSLLAGVELDNVFNPYKHRCPLHDKPNAPAIRRRNLAAFLTYAQEAGLREIWFGRDLGYRGGRRTGIALTDEVRLGQLAKLCGNADSIAQATKGAALGERTATVIWEQLARLDALPFLWNTFPFHPHEPEIPMGNRSHTRAERRLVWHTTSALLELLQPQRVIAIGNDAYEALSGLGINCVYVRHPSYGGQSDFIDGITQIYRLRTNRGASRQERLALAD